MSDKPPSRIVSLKPERFLKLLRGEKLTEDPMSIAEIAEGESSEATNKTPDVWYKSSQEANVAFAKDMFDDPLLAGKFGKQEPQGTFDAEGNQIGFSKGFDDGFEDHATPFCLGVPPGRTKKILQINDLHIPQHALESCTLAIKTGRDAGCDTVIISGDACDLANLSRHGYHGQNFNLKYEIDVVRRELGGLRRFFGDSVDIHLIPGNHEEWWRRHMRSIARLDDTEYRTLDERLGLSDLGITYHANGCGIVAGKHHFLHGHELRGSGKYLANRKLDAWLASSWGQGAQGGESISFGHHHVKQEAEIILGGRIFRSYAVGCLRLTSPEWHRSAAWHHGFAIAEISQTETLFRNYRIINGQIL